MKCVFDQMVEPLSEAQSDDNYATQIGRGPT